MPSAIARARGFALPCKIAEFVVMVVGLRVSAVGAAARTTRGVRS
jgi:hypothetical protein